MAMDFSGKIVLVTGGAKGVGKIIARRFAERGAHVIINYFHSLDAAKQTAAELQAMGAKADLIRASVARKDQVDRMFDEVESRFGRLDVLVNNAASGALLPMADVGEDHFDKALNTNLKGAFWCSRRAAPLLARSGGGAIVNLSSAGAGFVPANYVVVGTSKAALESLTRYLAVEFASQNTRVNTASATLIEGEVANLFPQAEKTKTSFIQAAPLKRLAEPDDMAGIVLFLASDASRWITGQVILADGGLSLCSEGLSPRPELPATLAAHPAEVVAPAPVAPQSAAHALAAPAVRTAAQQASAQTLPDNDDIAIVGMGVALPGANSPQDYWRVLVEGPELFGRVPSDRWDYTSFYSPDPAAPDKSYQAHSVFITQFAPHPRLQAEIDAGTAPAELTTRWLRHALIQAMEGVALRPSDRASFFVGYTADGSQHLEEAMVLAGVRSRMKEALAFSDASPEDKRIAFERIDQVLSARYERGASGFSQFLPHRVGIEAMRGVLPDRTEYMMVDTACSSSLYSVDLGIKSLLLGERDIAACGGSFALGPRGKVLFSKLHGLSKSGQVRPLDAASDGVLFSDGAGIVILKRLNRAIADGDTVLGLVKAFGSSSDGKGKAIYAPSAEGQSIAVSRAYKDEETLKGKVDWVVAHATGTPAGDLAEFQSLRQMFAGDRDVQITSNKSLIGHTGWAAGVASLIQVVLSMQHGVISPQHRFSAPPEDFAIETSNLRIPTQPVAWPAKAGSQRLAAISGFGFGGTNGHLVVADYRPDVPGSLKAPAPRTAAEPLVVTGWSAKLPGLENAAEIADWLNGGRNAPAVSFGETYPLPPFERVKMPPAVMKVLDRCQLMALDAAHDLKAQLKDYWDKESDTIGVVMGHMGSTRNAALYASRCYLDDIQTAVRAAVPGPLTESILASVRTQTARLIPVTTENSFPGMMPNVIPARVANYFDLHGLNMTVDAGHSSVLAAFAAAASYLRNGELSMAIVGGVNGNTAAEILPSVKGAPAEAIVLFAVTTLSRAKAAGLDILAQIDLVEDSAQAAAAPVLRDRHGQAVTYLGADGALAILQAMLNGREATVGGQDEQDASRYSVRIRPAVDAQAEARPDASPEASIADAPLPANTDARAPLPAGVASTTVATDDGAPLALKRYGIALQETPWQEVREPIAFLPARSVVVTDEPSLLDDLGPLPDDLIVLTLKPPARERPGWHHLAELKDGCLDEIVPDNTRHVRVLSSLHARDLAQGFGALHAPLSTALHDLAFLALKASYEGIGNNGSFVVLLADAVTQGVQHPNGGMFAGLAKSMAIELPSCRSLAVFTDAVSARVAAEQAERETAARHLLPVVVLSDGRRLAIRVSEEAGTLPADGMMPVGPQSVIVAFGGARGITAAVVKGLARHARPKLYLIGSSSIEGTSSFLSMSDEEFARSKPDYIRQRRAADPGVTMPQIIRDHDRLAAEREARRNIEEMTSYCGVGRVHYLQADVLDLDQVKAAVAQIKAREPQVDLVINAAGMGRAALVPVKPFHDYTAIRNLKVHGYWNLRQAFAGFEPKRWCNFGSLMGLTGQTGEIDYSSGNDLLCTQAIYRKQVLGVDEFTIGWTLWDAIGMAKNPVTRAFFEKSQTFTPTRTAEGVHHFLRELCIVDRGAFSVQLGANELRVISETIPGFFDRAEPAQAVPPAPIAAASQPAEGSTSRDHGFYLGGNLSRSADEAVFERVFDLTADAYLQHHVVNGFATLPGTFVPEIAAEAALQLIPGAVVTGFEDVVFHHFLRVYDAGRPSRKKVHARVIGRDGGRAVIQVRVTGDVTAPTGQILQRDKLHFELKVLTAPDYDPMLFWPKWPEEPRTPVADPYHFPAAPVHLTNMFVSTTDTCATPLGKRGRYKLDLENDDPVFSRFVLPSILLDGLARVGVLNHVAGDYIPLAAPASIRRIDIYEGGSDLDLSRRYDRIDLYVTPRDYALAGEHKNRFVAARPDGGMILQMRDLTGVVTGYVHRTTGAFVTAQEVDAILATQSAEEGAAA